MRTSIPRAVPPRVPGRAALAWLAPTLVLLVFVVLFVRTGMTEQTAHPWPRWSLVDFRDTVWVPVRDLVAGHDPYQLPGYLQRHPASQEFPPYAPMLLLIGAPFAAPPWPWAMALWGAVLVAALLVLVRRSASIAGRPGRTAWVALPLAALLVGPVGNQAFSAGQYAVVAAAASVVALSSTGAGTSSGVLSPASVACALALVKPQVGVPLLALLAVQRRWRVGLGGVGLAALLSAPVAAVLIARSGGLRNWVELLRRNVELTAASPVTDGGRIGSTRVDVVGTLQRVGYDPSGPVVVLVTVVATLVTIGAAHLAWRGVLEAPDDVRARLAWWAAAAASMLAWTPNELYSALVAVPALMLTASRTAAAGWWLLPGVLLAVPFLHVHRLDDLVGLSRVGEPVNGLAVVAAALAAAALARRTAQAARSAPAATTLTQPTPGRPP